MKKIALTLFLVASCYLLKAQGTNTLVEYTGSANATNIIGNEVYTFTKTGGGTWSKATITRFPIAQSETILTNKQTISNHQVLSDPTSTNYNVETDNGNQYATFEVGGPLTKLTLTRKYNASTNVDFLADCLHDDFPLSSSFIPANIQVYLNPSTRIQSNNSIIKQRHKPLSRIPILS